MGLSLPLGRDLGRPHEGLFGLGSHGLIRWLREVLALGLIARHRPGFLPVFIGLNFPLFSLRLLLQLLNGEVTRQGAMIAYDQVFSYMFLLTLVLFPLLMLIRPARAASVVRVEASHD